MTLESLLCPECEELAIATSYERTDDPLEFPRPPMTALEHECKNGHKWPANERPT